MHDTFRVTLYPTPYNNYISMLVAGLLELRGQV